MSDGFQFHKDNLHLGIHEKTGLYYRLDKSDDLFILNEGFTKQYKKFWPLCKDEIVLDVGGYIGDSAHFALLHGAKQVISLEPSPSNLEVYKQQAILKDSRLVLLEAAISSKNGTANFYMSDNNTKAHTLKKVRGRKSVTVETVSLEDIMTKYHPTVIKMDCEGGEGALDFSLLKDVKAIAMEIHPYYMTGGNERAQQIAEFIKSNFEVLFFHQLKIFGNPGVIEVCAVKSL